MKVGNNPRDLTSHTGSWRQAMLHRVVTPSKGFKEEDEYMSPMRYQSKSTHLTPLHVCTFLIKIFPPTPTQIPGPVNVPKTSCDSCGANPPSKSLCCRAWKRRTPVFKRVKMSTKLSASSWNTMRLPGVAKMRQTFGTITWRISQNWRRNRILCDCCRRSKMVSGWVERGAKCNRCVFLFNLGVPKIKRGDIWMFLAEQHNKNTAPIDTSRFPNYNTPYEVLLKSLTEHQHAIFIDLGKQFKISRTFDIDKV